MRLPYRPDPEQGPPSGLADDPERASDVLPMAKPRAIAAVVADNPGSFEVTSIDGVRVPSGADAHGARGKLAISTMLGFAPLADITHPRTAKGTKLLPPPSEVVQGPVHGEIEIIDVPRHKQITGKVTGPIILLDQRKELEPVSRWAAFEKLGMVPTKMHSVASKAIVSTYKLLGFGILTLIVTVLVGYIGSTAFYFMSSSWITPTVVSASDDKVVALKTELAAQQNNRDKIAADIHDADRAIAAEKLFQGEFSKAVAQDRESRLVALSKIKELAAGALATRNQIKSTNEEYAKTSAAKMKQDYDAHLVDQRAMMGGNFQLAQISSSNLSLAERQADLERQAAELGQQTSSLDALLSQKDTALSYDVLKIKRDYDTSKLALARALETKTTLTASLVRQDEIIAGLKKSSYLRALNDSATVALVPYDNLKNTKPGEPLYACKVAMLWCHQVGSVVEVLPGEVTFKHPKRDTMLRGQMVELRLDDPSAGESDVLFAGGRPLGV
jgi:hypothetical protein